MRISYIIPTRNRPERLAETLRELERLPAHAAEVVIADNASDEACVTVPELRNGLPVRVIHLGENLGAAARNLAAEASDPGSEWLVMLDDDSHPVDLGLLDVLARVESDVLGVSADIELPREGRRESGGLPEVFIGCGVALRREAFLAQGGYDASFGYYAEEYDLAAKLMLEGGRIEFRPEFRVAHHKVTAGRDMNLILGRLVRNSCWVAQRYTPESERAGEVRRIRRRYRRIAMKEQAVAGFARGLAELRQTIRRQKRRPMPQDIYERFTGMKGVRAAIESAMRVSAFQTACLVDQGKNDWVITAALRSCGVCIVDRPEDADALVIGTLSPGPMLDARQWWSANHPDERVISPWLVPLAESTRSAVAA